MKKRTILTFISSLTLAAQLLYVPVYAASDIGQSSAAKSACAGIQQIDSSQTCASSSGSSSIETVIKEIVNILSIALGGVAIVMIIVSGIRFATSGGSSNGVSGAKKTLIYAIVGLVIAALAQIIVRWVIGTSSSLVVSGLIIPKLY